MSGRWHVAMTLVTVLAVVGAGSAAAKPAQPSYVDAIGDANGLYVNEYENLHDNNGPDTRPASVPGADLVSAWFQTSYRVERDVNDSGQVVRVRHVPTAVELRVETAAPASPTFGPSLVYRFLANIGDCWLSLSSVVKGPASGEEEVEGARVQRGGPDCGNRSIEVPVRFEGNVMVLSFSRQQSLIDGVQILPIGGVIGPSEESFGALVSVVRVVNGIGLGGADLDGANPARPYVIGSDVPPDVDCVATPADPGCA